MSTNNKVLCQENRMQSECKYRDSSLPLQRLMRAEPIQPRPTMRHTAKNEEPDRARCETKRPRPAERRRALPVGEKGSRCETMSTKRNGHGRRTTTRSDECNEKASKHKSLVGNSRDKRETTHQPGSDTLRGIRTGETTK